MRTLLALLTIAAILICPYVCAVKEAVVRSSGQAHVKSCCQHCRSESSDTKSSSTEQQPATPVKTPVQESRTCVCEGAIFSVVDRIAIEVTWQASLWISVPDPIVVFDSQNPLATIDLAGLPPPWRGLQRRIVLNSLLI
jgi:hypothetical protein